MASITYWNRLEPRPRSADIDRTLGAEIRDPLWMLTRQWQVGEFQGEDAASPASIQLTTRSTFASGWRPEGAAPPNAYDLDAQPLERVFQEEPFDEADFSLAVELGLLFEEILLAVRGVTPSLALRLRAALPLEDVTERDPRWKPHDESTRSFLAVCGGRALDGVRVLRGVREHGTDPWHVFPGVMQNDDEAATTANALGKFREAVPGFAGALSADRAREDPPAWRRETLRYGAELTSPAGTFSITPDRDGVCDWWSFDQTSGRGSVPIDATVTQTATRTVLPAHVRFRGMPNARWWDFESDATDFGDVRVDRRDLARMAVMEFMLVQGNDWFMVPFHMHVGTFCQIDSLIVRDVFGGETPVPRADTTTGPRGPRWTMFTTTRTAGGLADFFHLPPSIGATRQDGPVLEEVQFLRDEMANMAWAIEHTVPTQIGEPFDHRARGDEDRARRGTPRPPTRPDGSPSLRWVLQTETPAYWYPLLPVRIVGGVEGQIALRLGRTALATESETARSVPVGRVLRPPREGEFLQWREEEIPREGVRLVRRCVRSRWIDGSTHVWVMRARQTGSGEGSSGLRFDVAEFRPEAPGGGTIAR